VAEGLAAARRRMSLATARWLYYVVEDAWVARVSENGVEAELLKPDGRWVPRGDERGSCELATGRLRHVRA
jgi:hypothetical protein